LKRRRALLANATGKKLAELLQKKAGIRISGKKKEDDRGKKGSQSSLAEGKKTKYFTGEDKHSKRGGRNASEVKGKCT